MELQINKNIKIEGKVEMAKKDIEDTKKELKQFGDKMY